MKRSSLPLTKQILVTMGETIFNSINALIELSPSRINRHIFGESMSLKSTEHIRQAWKTRRAIRELERHTYIEAKKQGNKILYQLTERGITELVLTTIKMQSKMLSDGQMCVICFDIPMSANDVRWPLRRFLRTAGFKQLQKSVWYTRKDVFDVARVFVKNLKAGEWVKIMLTTIIE